MFSVPTRTFKIYRDGECLSTQEGSCAKNGQKKYGFDISVDIKVGDTLIEQESQNQYDVVDIRTSQAGYGRREKIWADLKLKK